MEQRDDEGRHRWSLSENAPNLNGCNVYGVCGSHNSSSTACQFRAQRPHDAAHRRDFSLFVLALMALGVAVGGAGCGRGGAARQDRSADPGERFFGCALLGRAIHCVVEATASSAPFERRADRIMSGYVNREAVHPGYRLRVWLMP